MCQIIMSYTRVTHEYFLPPSQHIILARGLFARPECQLPFTFLHFHKTRCSLGKQPHNIITMFPVLKD